jgi:adenylate cyclase class IV
MLNKIQNNHPTANTQVEVEIKVLLGQKINADNLVTKIKVLGFVEESQNNQLNHYFLGETKDFANLRNGLKTGMTPLGHNWLENFFVKPSSITNLGDILASGGSFSLRTRQLDGKILLVVKASIDSTTSENGTARMEFEEGVNLSLDELDSFLIGFGFGIQAKWSRQRQEFVMAGSDTKICLDKNAGYGYLAEFEQIVPPTIDILEVKKELRDLIKSLDLEELDQTKLAKMFDYYNQNWQDYYGTEKVFEIE